MFSNNAPKGRGIRCADRLAFEDDRCVAVSQRRITNIGMSNDPTHVRGGPKDIARIHIVDVFHRPVQRHQMASGGADNALWGAGCARGIENISRMITGHGHAGRGGYALLQFMPFDVPRSQFCFALGALQNNAKFRFMRSQIDRAIEQWFIGYDAAGLDAAGTCNNCLWRGIINTDGQFICGKAAEDNRMDRADADTCQHGHQGLRDHGHVDDNPVSRHDPFGGQPACKGGDLLLQLCIGGFGFLPCDRAIIDNGHPIAMAGLNMAINGVVAGVDLRILKPFVQGGVIIPQSFRGRFDPINRLGRFHPKCLWVCLPTGINFFIGHPFASTSVLRRLFPITGLDATLGLR